MGIWSHQRGKLKAYVWTWWLSHSLSHIVPTLSAKLYNCTERYATKYCIHVRCIGKNGGKYTVEESFIGLQWTHGCQRWSCTVEGSQAYKCPSTNLATKWKYNIFTMQYTITQFNWSSHGTPEIIACFGTTNWELYRLLRIRLFPATKWTELSPVTYRLFWGGADTSTRIELPRERTNLAFRTDEQNKKGATMLMYFRMWRGSSCYRCSEQLTVLSVRQHGDYWQIKLSRGHSQKCTGSTEHLQTLSNLK